MDFKQLQSYITAVKFKSFTMAAEKLGISQPTISTHIRILEAELDARLLSRNAKSFEVTQKGWEVYEAAQEILKVWEDMLNRWGDEESRVIRLGVSTIPSAYILPEVLPDFKKRYENVCFEISQEDSRAIIDAVHNGSYDIGLVGMKTEDDTLEFQPFYQDRMVLITPATEPYLSMREQEQIPLKELFAEPMILRERGSGSRRSAEHFMREMGISEEQLSVTARMNDQESIKNLVAGGLGLSIISEKAVQDSLDANRLLKFDLPGEPANRQFYLIYQKGRLLKEYAKAFRDYLLNYYVEK